MEKGWHEAQNVRISHLADEMVKLFTSGHLAEQTAQYEAKHEEYLQAMTDAALSQVFDQPLDRPHTTIG